MSFNGKSELSDDEDLQNTLPVIEDEAKAATMNLRPKKSNEKYEKEFISYMKWCRQKRVENHLENVLVVYFSLNARVLKSFFLWFKYSMLRTMLLLKETVDIKYLKVIAFLKCQFDGYKPLQSKTFSIEEINKYLIQAPGDNNYEIENNNIVWISN